MTTRIIAQNKNKNVVSIINMMLLQIAKFYTEVNQTNPQKCLVHVFTSKNAKPTLFHKKKYFFN
jgi:hypothetical protein